MARTATERATGAGRSPGPGVGAAWVEAQRRLAEQRRRRDRSLARHGVALLVLLGTIWAVHAVREVPDPRHTAGLTLTAEMDAAFAAVAAGRLELPEQPARLSERVTGATVIVGERTLGVLTGEAGGECFAHWWDGDLVRHARVLAPGIPCRPATIVTSIRPVHFDRLGPIVADDGPYGWERILRDPIRERTWFLPVTVLLGAVALSVVTRITTTLITGKPPSQLAREERRRKR